MQNTSANKQHRHKRNEPSKPRTKPKTQSWRKQVDWAAAGRKAYQTRMKNLKKNKKAGNIRSGRGNTVTPQQEIRK